MILVGVAVVAAVIVVVLEIQKNKDVSLVAPNQPGQQTQESSVLREGDEGLVEAVAPIVSDMEQVELPNVGKAQVVIPGANLITSDNIVVAAPERQL